jgi:hypothetical protein
MSVDTHCLPTGSLGTGELGVPATPGPVVPQAPVSGSKRGLIVLLHGITATTSAFPCDIIEDLTGATPTLWQTLATDLTNDHWVVIMPIFAEDGPPDGNSVSALRNDISNDAGNGARYLRNMLHWWDHVVDWAAVAYPSYPLVPLGVSWGGWHAIKIASQRTSTITGYVAHVPVTVVSAVSTIFGGLTTTGMDVAINSPSDLDSVTGPPGLISVETGDAVSDYPDAVTLYNTAYAAGANVSLNQRTGGAHQMDSTDVTTITNFVTASIDPLCPATH